MVSEEKLKELKGNFVKYSNRVRDMIDKSFSGLLVNNSHLPKDVLQTIEPKINEEEIALDEECITFLARYRPEAKNLRSLLMISKMVADLERMGDMACNIADSVLYLINKPPVKPYIDLPRMKEVTLKMFDDGITSFVECDADLAKRTVIQDEVVDGLRDQIMRELITYMIADGSTIERSLHILRITRNLERIADLSTNICEDVIFIEEGVVAKHRHDEIDEL